MRRKNTKSAPQRKEKQLKDPKDGSTGTSRQKYKLAKSQVRV